MLIPIHRKRDLFALIEICSSSIGVEHFVSIMKDKPACDHVDSHRRGINMTAVQNVNHLHIPTADQVRELMETRTTVPFLAQTLEKRDSSKLISGGCYVVF